MASDGTGWSSRATFKPASVVGSRGGARDAAGRGLLHAPMASAELATMTVTSSEPCGLSGNGSVSDVVVEITLSLGRLVDGRAGAPHVVALSAQLFGPRLALVLSKDTSVVPAPVQTMADFNAAVYGKAAAGVPAVATPPRRFPVMDRFIGGDDDLRTWSGGIGLLTQLGMHGLEVEGGNNPQGYPLYNSVVRQELVRQGHNITSSAEYAVPGTAPATGANTAASLHAWASELSAPFLAAGYTVQQMTAFALADEPGWDFPGSAPEVFYPAIRAQWEAFLATPAFRLQPADFGAASWAAVLPNSTRWGLRGPMAKRYFYWTTRFSAWASAAAFAQATLALEGAFYKGIPAYVNFNNFAGRSYTPTSGGGKNPNTAILSPDWFEMGRARGATLLWTEDWFGDTQAAQWSYYLSRLRSAARLAPSADVSYGGYVVPRTSGDPAMPDGIVKKALSVVASGAKSLKYFMFGPEYLFPGNCWSDVAWSNPSLFAGVAQANSMIGAAEELLWPATRVVSEVALLYPRTSSFWDERGVEYPGNIIDNGNSNMDVYTVDYLAEAFGLYNALALQRNIAVDFIDEDGLLDPTALSHLKIIFVTGPNIPNASMTALVEWVKRGGMVVTTSSAATTDEIDQPSSILNGASGLRSVHNGRTPVGTHQLGPFGPAMKAGTAAYCAEPARWPGMQPCFATCCQFTALGEAGSFVGDNGTSISAWLGSSGGGAATKWADLGLGVHVHFAWLPGVSHTYGGSGANEKAISTILSNLTSAAGVVPPVSVSSLWVEAPLLHGPDGSVVALLNWTDHGYDDVTSDASVRGPRKTSTLAANHGVVDINITLGYDPTSATSVKHGALAITKLAPGTVHVQLKLGAADFLMFRK